MPRHFERSEKSRFLGLRLEMTICLLISVLCLLSACSGSGKFSKQDCSNFPLLVTDCMAKDGCGLRGGDNVNYESCKLECEDRIHKQCLVQKVAPKK